MISMVQASSTSTESFYATQSRTSKFYSWYFLDIKAYITIAIQLRYDYETTISRRIRLRRKWSKLRFAFDSTAIRQRHDSTKNWHVHFLLASNRVEWKQARAIRRSRIVVVSQSNRNCDIGTFLWYSKLRTKSMQLNVQIFYFTECVRQVN